MKLMDISELLEDFAPAKYAAKWDNVGLMIGSLESDINKIMLTLDVTSEVVDEAIEKKCNLIVSHHPMFFSDLKSIDFDKPNGDMVKKLISNNICVYSCHTNLDACENGINAYLADLFELRNITVLEPNENNPQIGIGRIGTLKSEVSLDDFCDITKNLLKTPFLRVVASELNSMISKVCVASGSCGDLIELAKTKGSDVIITADVKYHEALNAKDIGISVIDAGHFPTERIVVEIYKELLKETGIELVSSVEKDIFGIK